VSYMKLYSERTTKYFLYTLVLHSGGKIIRTVLCCTTVVHNDTHTHTCEQLINLHIGLGLIFHFVRAFKFTILCVVLCQRRSFYSGDFCFLSLS